ncbi:MAG: hypothetical protein RLZZ15_4514 [Verrucomicrobiota bacterium]|jgi:capsular exopolysaccharide synthesis family protein
MAKPPTSRTDVASKKKSPPPSPGLAATVDLRQPFVVLRAHLWVALALTIVVCSLVAWQQVRQPKLYLATASIVVERGDKGSAISEAYEERTSELSVGTRLEQMKSPEVAQRVAKSLTDAERDQVLAAVASGPASPVPNPDRLLLSAVRRGVTIERRVGTMLIEISAISRDPQVAALLANRFADQAIRYAQERYSSGTDNSLKFLGEQAEEVRIKAEVAERQLQAYRQKHNLVSLEANQNIIVDNLKSLNGSATAARVARFAIDATIAQAEEVLKRTKDAEQLAAITKSEGLSEIARRIAELQGRRTVMSERYGRRHPLMQENERAIGALEKQRDELAQTAMVSLRDRRDTAIAEEKQLALQLAAAEKAALDLDALGVEYNILRRAVDSHKASYVQVLTRRNDATLSSQMRGVALKISDSAYPPSVPFSPNLRKTGLLVGGLAVLILFGYPFCAELFFGRIRNASDVEFHLGADVLGEVGSVRRTKETDRPMLVRSEQDEGATEQFRALYSQLSLSSKIDAPKAILVTSTLPSEGKSFVASNLAHSLVAHNRRTLLIDADFRRPAQHRQFGLDNRAGTVRWLDEGGKVEGDLLKDPRLGIVEIYPGLCLLRTGGISRKASELMEGDRLPELFRALQRQFDVMIVDTPPAGIFPDAVGFAKVCHEFIYICRFNTASRQAVRGVLERLTQTGLEFPGVVLNAMPTGLGGSYYYKGYSYHSAKSYAKHYGEPAKK